MPLSETTSEGSYEVPETFLNLDEVAGPSNKAVVPKRKHGFIFFPDQKRNSPSISSGGAPTAATETTGTTEPSVAGSEATVEQAEQLTTLPRRDSWGNLTTVTERPTPRATPRPDTATRTSRVEERHSRTEARRSRAEDRHSRAEERRSRAEERRSHSPSPDNQLTEKETETVDSSIWQSARKKRFAKFLTTLYTLGYLVFFSILGTLARLGLQALTSYPDAPVTTPVLWANFAGSLVMGFLAEDRKLFMEEWGERHRAREQYMEWLKERRQQRRMEHIRQKRERELFARSHRYSDTHQAPRPFTNPVTARLYPNSRVFTSRFPPSDNHSAPSIITESAPANEQDLAEEKKRHIAVKKTIPLYIGLATGFCGSFTSFSTFMRDSFLALANSSPSYPTPLNGFASEAAMRSGGFSFLALMAILIYEPAVSIGGLYAGGHLALALDDYVPSIPFMVTSQFLDRIGVVLGFGSWIGAIIMAILPPDRPGGPASGAGSSWDTESWRGSVLFAVVFAPLGCILRFYVSMLLNARLPSFPLGTFAVNILGSALEACFYALQHTTLGAAIGGGRLGCQLLQGAMDGFCGCLTTVSTWVVELTGLKRRAAYVYGVTSLVAGLMVMVVIMGPIRWGHGFATTACGV